MRAFIFRVLLPVVGLFTGLQPGFGQEGGAPTAAPKGSLNDAMMAKMQAEANAYAEAFSKKDFETLGKHWTTQAELNEAGRFLQGRANIVTFIRSTFVRAPKAQMEIKVDRVRVLGEETVRVAGVIRVRENADARWFSSKFESLRVKEGNDWQIASSTVVAVPEASLEDLGWLVGKWKAEATEGEDKGLVVEGGIQKMLDGQLLVVHLKRQRKDAPAVESIQILHADRHDAAIRTWIFESTGGRAEGVLESDGHTLNSVLLGQPGNPEIGNRVGSVHVLTPISKDEFLWQPIERVIDGVRLPDQKPLHFKRQK